MRAIWLSVAAAIAGLALVGALGASEAAHPERAKAGVSAYATTSTPYGWPLKPFHSPHPVRGNFGDPRTVFYGPPTAATLYHGSGSFSFHRGADIYGPQGAKVYPVRSGIVVFLSASHVNVQSSDGTTFEYWHIGSHRLPGTFVRAEKTVLGRIGSGGHVDLTEVQNGHAVNPLAPGHLTPYKDRTHPTVSSIRLQSDNAGTVVFPNYVTGSVWLVAQAFDKPSLPVPGIWRGLPVTPALVSWRIQQPNGTVVVPTRVAADFRTNVPENNAFWSIYARGTFQNMTAFDKHYSSMQPGCYLFLLSPTRFDTHSLGDGVYDLVVTAKDIRGNSSSRSLRFTVHNAGPVSWPPTLTQLC
jgi:hypothetical protein